MRSESVFVSKQKASKHKRYLQSPAGLCGGAGAAASDTATGPPAFFKQISKCVYVCARLKQEAHKMRVSD